MEKAIKKRGVEGENVQDTENPVKVIMDAVPDSKKKEVKEALMIMRSELYSGPIPPPEALARYE